MGYVMLNRLCFIYIHIRIDNFFLSEFVMFNITKSPNHSYNKLVFSQFLTCYINEIDQSCK